MIMKYMNILIALSLFLFSNTGFAEEHTVGQKNKAFSVKQIKIKKGDVIHFENQDPFFHNVYSLSDSTTFDLGSFPKGESKSVTFNTPGTIPVECAIHPNMYMEVIVE
ncbi:MAG: cupredoxin domain-containing protein [gamma proteobacterium symbiont of Taylorina sp.]|nr:cupredoxin domain-containing protein [gamma proteobacterium symbiont of Taylorina sp.]